MSVLELPKNFDDFVDARKAGFLKVKEYVENLGVKICISTVYEDGSDGALELATTVIEEIDNTNSKLEYYSEYNTTFSRKIAQ